MALKLALRNFPEPALQSAPHLQQEPFLLAVLVGCVLDQGPLQDVLHMKGPTPELQLEWMLVLASALEWLPKVSLSRVDIPLGLEWPVLLPLNLAPHHVRVLKLESTLLLGLVLDL